MRMGHDTITNQCGHIFDHVIIVVPGAPVTRMCAQSSLEQDGLTMTIPRWRIVTVSIQLEQRPAHSQPADNGNSENRVGVTAGAMRGPLTSIGGEIRLSTTTYESWITRWRQHWSVAEQFKVARVRAGWTSLGDAVLAKLNSASQAQPISGSTSRVMN